MPEAIKNFFEAGSFETGYRTCDDFVEIMAGTNMKTHPMYVEATKDVSKTGNKSLASLKRFITAIENVASEEKVKDSRISSSKGNMKNFKGYDNIKICMEFMSKNLSGIPMASDLKKLHDCLDKFQPQYSEAYEKKVRLIVLEYESSLYMLITGLSTALATNMDVVQNGDSIKIQKKEGSTGGLIAKTLKDLVNQLTSSSHKDYLEAMLKSVEYKPVDTKIEESTDLFIEGSVADTFELIDSMVSNIGKIGHYTKSIASSIVKSVFGIIPLIRSIMYLRFKKKADTVNALEQQARFLEQNIEVVKNKQSIEPAKKAAIIRRQQAIVNGYKKRAEKLRAELTDGEREAATSIQNMNQEVHSKKDDETDFVLESVGFMLEKTDTSLKKKYKKYSDHCKQIGIEPDPYEEWKKDKED